LTDEILTHGFVSDGDPVLLSGKTAPESYGEVFTLCYVKGAARASTLLVILDQVMMAGDANIWETFPGLASTSS